MACCTASNCRAAFRAPVQAANTRPPAPSLAIVAAPRAQRARHAGLPCLPLLNHDRETPGGTAHAAPALPLIRCFVQPSTRARPCTGCAALLLQMPPLRLPSPPPAVLLLPSLPLALLLRRWRRPPQHPPAPAFIAAAPHDAPHPGAPQPAGGPLELPPRPPHHAPPRAATAAAAAAVSGRAGRSQRHFGLSSCCTAPPLLCLPGRAPCDATRPARACKKSGGRDEGTRRMQEGA